MRINAVPLPPAFWLFGSALLGLFGIGRRKLVSQFLITTHKEVRHMLMLTRREGETLTLSPSKDIEPHMTARDLFADGPITIEVVESGSQTELGIDAPRDLKGLWLELSSEHNN